jgi:chemotaxis family two-component system sensor kinase Cph1
MTDKKSFDSDFCGNLPLHNVNLIQDYGYLLVLDKDTLNIIQTSENITEVTGTDFRQMIGNDIAEYLDVESLEEIKKSLAGGPRQRIPLSLRLKSEGVKVQFHALMHIKADYILIELEQADELEARSFPAVFQDVKKIMYAIEQAKTVQEVCEITVHELRKISGFDGVLMYKFDEDWNGTVMAEEKDERLDAYIGQTFPASDIPKQARQLYLKNPYRLIPNRDYQPVRLYPVINPITNSFIDLSDCNLRSVPAVHLEYMKNMNINASMSIRVIKGGQLWGLISCHHLTAQYLNYEVCSVFEWLSAVISNAISHIIEQESFSFAKTLQHKRSLLTDRVYELGDLVEGLIGDEQLSVLDVFNAGGVAVILNGRLQTKGEVPGKNDIENLIFWLEGKNINNLFYTDHLAGRYDDAESFAKVGSGILLVPIDATKGDYLICFRPEVVETINWGGDPNQAINFEKDGIKYHPRNSFKLWKQQVKNYALPWKPEELEVAESLRTFLFEFRAKQLYN